MRADQFVSILRQLEMSPASQRAAKAFGLSMREFQRITAGRSPVPGPVALLAKAYTTLGESQRLSILRDIDAASTPADTIAKFLANLHGGVEPSPSAEELVAISKSAKQARAEKAAEVVDARRRRAFASRKGRPR